MRTIDLTGTKASYSRLSRIAELPDFGLSIEPEMTAPFNIRYMSEQICVFIDDSLVAIVVPDGPRLEVRDDYPQDLDYALLRAINNACGVTDTMSKIEKQAARDQKAANPDNLLVQDSTKRDDRFQIQMDEKRLNKSLIGIMGIESRIITSGRKNFYPHMTIKRETAGGVHEISYSISQKNHDNDVWHFETTQSTGNYYVNHEAFKNLINEGELFYEQNFSSGLFLQDLNDIIAMPKIDHLTPSVLFNNISPKLLTDDLHDLVLGNFVVRTIKRSFTKEYCGFNVSYKGVSVHNSNADRYNYDGILSLMNPAPDETKNVIKKIGAMWKAQVLGLDVNKMSRMSRDAFKESVEGADFGYF